MNYVYMCSNPSALYYVVDILYQLQYITFLYILSRTYQFDNIFILNLKKMETQKLIVKPISQL